MPLIVCTARNNPPTGERDSGVRSHSSSIWLQVFRCSRLSARKSAAYFARSMRSAQDPLHRLEHARWLERLHHEVLGARLNRLDYQRLLAHRAAHEDLGVGIALADFPDGLDSAHVGHDDVHGHEIGLELAELLHRLEARLRLTHDLE